MSEAVGNLLARIDLPPVWTALTALAMTLVAWLTPWRFDADVMGWLLLGVGAGLIFLAAPSFLLANTPIMPRQDPNALITGGIYKISRNPIYLGMLVLLIGWGLILGSWPALPLLAGFVLIVNKRFIADEEARLVARFPEAAPRYFARVRRWI